MKKLVRISIATAILIGFGSVGAQAAEINIIDNVKIKGEVRARYERVDLSGANNANALTNRLTVGASADMFGTDWLGAYVEMTDVRALNDNYNDFDGSNGIENNAIVADPQQTRLTQAYIDIKYGKTNLRAGRQVINLDNQRFIGSVGWRQMFQTMDAYTLTNKSIKNLDLFASYITQRNTILNSGSTHPALTSDSLDTRDLLINVAYKAMPELKVTAYSYMLGSTHDTYGLALTGNAAVSDGLKVNYRAEYAMQGDSSIDKSGQGEGKADASYYNLALGVNISGILTGAGYEVLSGDGDGTGSDTAFQTPYATLHAHNGWADMFLRTPTGGIEDMSVYLGYKAKGFGLAKVVFHDFKANKRQTGFNDDYGQEIDFIYKNKIPVVKGLTGMIKYASFDAEKGTSAYQRDKNVLWVMLDYKF